MTENFDLGTTLLFSIVITAFVFMVIFLVRDAVVNARINREWKRKIAKARALQAPMWRSTTVTTRRPPPTSMPSSGKTREGSAAPVPDPVQPVTDPLLYTLYTQLTNVGDPAPVDHSTSTPASHSGSDHGTTYSDHSSHSSSDHSYSSHSDHGSSYSDHSSSFDGGFSDGGGSSGGFD